MLTIGLNLIDHLLGTPPSVGIQVRHSIIGKVPCGKPDLVVIKRGMGRGVLYFNSTSNASNTVLPTFFIKYVAGPTSQRTLPAAIFIGSNLPPPFLPTTILPGETATQRPDSGCM